MGDLGARNELVMQYYPLVIKIATQYMGKGSVLDDLIQEGVIGLMRGCMKFDYRQGVRFSTYVCYWIKQAIQMVIVKNANIVKVPIRKTIQIAKIKKRINESSECDYQDLCEEFDVKDSVIHHLFSLAKGTLSLDYKNEGGQEFSECVPCDPDAYNVISDGEFHEVFSSVMQKHLTEREQLVLNQRYGLNGVEKKSLRDVGDMIDISPEGVRRIESIALEKLSQPEVKAELSGFYC